MKLTRKQLRGLILEQMEVMGMGQPDPELVAGLKPFLDLMMQAPPGTYTIALEDFKNGSAYDPMGASMYSTLQMIKLLAKRADDTEMRQLVDETVLPDGRTFLQTAQEEDDAASTAMVSADDPTEMADPFASAPADPTAMDDPFPIAESLNEVKVELERWNLLAGINKKSVL